MINLYIDIKYILSNLKLTEEEIIKAYVNYDLDIYAYENEIYESISMRVVLHLHNLLKESWHQDRQNTILEMVKKVKPETIIDMGFGVPTRYIRRYVLDEKIKLVLLDMYESAFEFSEILLDYLYKSWKEFISFKKLDMNANQYPGDFGLYLFQDSIEHVGDSTGYLSKIVNQSPNASKFILSLPIGPKVPVHTISWNNEKEARDWLRKCGLKPIFSKKVFINPKVDLFAEQFNEKFYNLIVLCDKQ